MVLIGINDGTDDDLRSLFTFLQSKDEFDGLIQLVADSSADHLGGFADAVAAAVDYSDLVSVLVGTVAVWLRSRGSDVKVSFTKSGDQQAIELDSRRIRKVDATELREIVQGVAAAISEVPDDDPSR